MVKTYANKFKTLALVFWNTKELNHFYDQKPQANNNSKTFTF